MHRRRWRLFAASAAIRPLIRPIYIAKGILPAVAADPQAATDIPADELAALNEAGAVQQASYEQSGD